jgi:ATP-binding cassette, subfamily B, bacterial IrtB/YbtQ
MTAAGATERFYQGPVRTTWRLLGDGRRSLALSIVFRFIQSFFTGVPVALLVWVIDQIRRQDLTATEAWVVSAITVGSFFAQYGAAYLSNRLAWISTFLAVGEARLAALAHLQRVPLGVVLGRQQGDVTNVVTTDFEQVSKFASHGLPTLMGGIGLPFTVLVLLLVVDPALAAAVGVSVVVAAPVLIFINRYFRAGAARRSDQMATTASRIIEYVQGIAVARSFNQTGPKLKWFKDAVSDMRAVNDAMAVKLTPWAFVAIGVVLLGMPLVLAVSTYMWFGGRIDVTTMLVFAVLGLRVYQPLIQVAISFEDLRIADAALERIGSVMDLEEAELPADPGSGPADATVSFESVTFGYHPERPVLAEVSFEAPPGTLTAIVGPSGAGKSTLLNLVGRFWQPDEGTVSIGGVDMRLLTDEQVFGAVTMVFQDVVLFQGTVRQNIAMGRVGATDGEIEAAARAAQAHDFIVALPDGYDTPVGEGGAMLSGGERQRVSIARAMLKGAPIVLLDEATASIDPINERAVQAALATLVEDKTVLVVAHRLSTITSADQILVLAPPEPGAPSRIVERGTHAELLANGGLYAHLWAERERASRWRIAGRTRIDH